MATKTLPAHGTLSRHKHYGCNCQPCRDNFHAYSRRRYRLKGYGTWQPLTDAEPVRQHIATLRAAGHSVASICRDANVSAATAQRILYGVQGRPPAARMRTDAAQRILSIQPHAKSALDDACTIDGTGTRRRLQALVAIGWPLSQIGPRVGIHPRPLTTLLRADRVYASTRRTVADGYRKLHTADPAAHGVPAPVITSARNWAKRQGWHGPLAWDDIDDPEAEPEADGIGNEVATRRDKHTTTEIKHLAGFGIPEHEIARRVNRSQSYVHEHLAGRRAPGWRQQQKETAA